MNFFNMPLRSYLCFTKKRPWCLALFIIVIIIFIYSLVWYLLSSHLQNWIEERLAISSSQGIAIYCENPHKTGFPMRIGGSCDKINYQWPTAGIAFSTNGFIASSPIFAPQWRSLQVVAPAKFEIPGLQPIGAEWEKLQIDSELDHGKITELKLRADNIKLHNYNENSEEIALLKADFIRLISHLDAKKMDLDITYDQLQLPFFTTRENVSLPLINGKATLTLDDPQNLILPQIGAWSNRLRSMHGVIKSASVIFEQGGQLTLSGDFNFSDEGYLNGAFQVVLIDIADLNRTIRILYPSQSANISSFFFALNALPKDNKGNPIISFRVDNGKVSMISFELGSLPPV